MKTAVITGTTSGIGLATSIKFAQQDYRVFAGVRDLSKSTPITEISESKNLLITPFRIDVCDSESVSQSLQKIQEEHDIDVLVNNAGIAGAAPLEFTSEEDHRRIFETNYFGAVRCIQSVIKRMREREQGAIVNVSSAAGLIATPNQIAYSASKWAMECMGEALASEMARFNVRVVNVEPNVVMTDIFKNSSESTYFDPASPYLDLLKRSSKLFAAGMRNPASVQDVANTIFEAITSDEFKLRWPVGESAEKIHHARRNMSSEDWISLGGVVNEESFIAEFEGLLGINLEA